MAWIDNAKGVAALLAVLVFWPMQAAAQTQRNPAFCAASYYWLDSQTGNAQGSDEFKAFVRLTMRHVNGEFDPVAAQARSDAERLSKAVDAGQIPVYAVLAQAEDCSRQFGVPLSGGHAKTVAKEAVKSRSDEQARAQLVERCMVLLKDYERSFPSDVNYFAARMKREPGPEGDAFVDSVMQPLFWYEDEAKKAGCPSEILVLMSNGNGRLSKLCKVSRSLGIAEQNARQHNQDMEDLEYLRWLNNLR